MADQNDNRFDRVSTVAKAALALGAGAAFLYRGGGNELLSSGLRKTSYALNNVANSISGKTLKDINGQGKTFFKEALKTFKESFREYNGEIIDLRLDNPHSALNALQLNYSLRQNANKVLADMYMKESFIPGLKKELQDSFEDTSSKKINNIVDKITSHMSEALEKAEVAGHEGLDDYHLTNIFRQNELSDFNKEQQDLMDEIINRRFLNKKEELQRFQMENEERIFRMQEILTDYEALANNFGVAGKENSSQLFINNLLGDRQATFNDVLRYANEHEENIRKLDFIGVANQDPQDVLKAMRDLVAQDSRNGDLFVDPSLRITNNGKLISFAEAANMEERFEEKFLHTIFGKLSKPLENRVYKNNADNLIYLAAGSTDYQLPKLLEGNVSTVLQNSYVYINKQGYKIDGTQFIRMNEFDNLIPVSGRYGATTRLMKNITGDIDVLNINRNYLYDKLDMGASPKMGPLMKTSTWLQKFADPSYGPNLLSNYLKTESMAIDSEQYFDDMKNINNMFKAATKKLDRQTINLLANKNMDDETREIFDLLKLGDKELLSKISDYPISNTKITFENEDLTSLVLKYKRDPKKGRSLLSISEDVANYGLSKKYTKSENYVDMLRKELSKEGFLRYRKTNGEEALVDLIENSGLTAQQRKKAKRLSSWAIFQSEGNIFTSRTAPYSYLGKEQLKNDVAYLFLNQENKESKQFQESIMDIAKNGFTFSEDGNTPQSYLKLITKANRPNDYIFIKKAINPLDIIKSENKATTTKAFFKQFVAGRNNMEDLTTATLYPYFMLHRLTESLPALIFSPKNTGSTLDIAKAIMTKRVLPVALGIGTFNYLNFESRNLTGKSISEAALNSWSNFDLGIRGLTDHMGLTDKFKDSWYTNPAVQYLKEDPYRSQDEQVDYLKNGYKPVRKGRWWGMSTSEFRGGKIEYFEPTYLKQASVPWREISLYGSENEKWKHSWLPTPRHPLSPIRNFLDPYWLERKHKYDRPYPVSAPLFSEGTPWGAIGNATIGNLVKPQIRMGQEVLGKSLIDVRDLIAEENQRIKNKANHNTITITGSNTATEESTPIPANTIGDGYGIDIGPGGPSNISAGQGSGNNVHYNNHYAGHINLLDKLMLGALEADIALPQLQSMNEEIKYKAYTRGTAQTTFAKRYDNMIANNTLDLLKDNDIRSDLLNLNTKQEYLSDMGYSAKELSGIYGFIFDTVIPGKKRYRLENANNMYSFTSRFWDESIGGAGGGFMEIARRFFPHENRDITNINPLRNNMPSWMPERFKHGDPYTMVAKGEMRLPGAGYEAINHYTPNINYSINPLMIGSSKKELVNYFLNKSEIDQRLSSFSKNQIYVTDHDLKQTQKNIKAAQKEIEKLIKSGKINSGEFYSDFQRFKILADVAPYSQEYKEYKGKVKDQLTSDQKKEYYQILDRVDRQNKQHDFFPYLYKGFNEVSKEGYIDQIHGNQFTLVGSNQVYTLAGVKSVNTEALSQKIAQGMKVNIKYDKLDQEDPIIKAIIFDGTNNINKDLIRNRLAERSVSSAIDAHAIASSSQQMMGALMERIGHMPIPYFHNRFLKLETGRESYENNQVYGTSYSTWEHPIQGYIQPAFNRSMNVSPLHAALGATAFAANMYIDHIAEKNVNKGIKIAASAANMLITPGAFTGSIIGFGINMNESLISKGMKTGSAIWATGYLLNNAKNPFVSIASGSMIGYYAGEFLEKGSSLQGAKAGALIGLGISFLRNPDMKLDTAFGKWIPQKTQKRWDIEEYFDRLEYIKYKGLYERASQKALKKEGVNIKKILIDMEKQEKHLEKNKNKLLKYKQNLSNSYMKNTAYGQRLMSKIDNQLNASIGSITLESRPYTKSALAYKQAMDSTIYGLKENASWAQILRALPKNDRDYFLEFAKVKDPKEQKKILKVVSPYKRKILQQLWGMKIDKLESNESYFSKHKLPSMFWAGWKPTVDMDNIKMKTIQNEGMLLSDFGMYDSNLQQPAARNTEGIKNYDSGTNLLSLKKNLFTSLTGIGLTGVEVSIEPSQTPGIQMITNFARISDYNIKQKINSIFGRAYY